MLAKADKEIVALEADVAKAQRIVDEADLSMDPRARKPRDCKMS